MSYARAFENGSLPLIHLSITTLRPVLITRVPQRGAPKGTPLQIGKYLAPCYGFMENVYIPLLSGSKLSLTAFWIDSWLWEEYCQVRYHLPSCVLSNLYDRQAP